MSFRTYLGNSKTVDFHSNTLFNSCKILSIKQRNRNGGRQRIPTCWFIPQISTIAESGSWAHKPGVLCGWQGPNDLCLHYHLSLRESTGSWNQECGSDPNPGPMQWGGNGPNVTSLWGQMPTLPQECFLTVHFLIFFFLGVTSLDNYRVNISMRCCKYEAKFIYK